MTSLTALILNYFLVFVESLSLIFLCKCFFDQKYTGLKFFLAVLILAPLHFLGLALSDWNIFLKLLIIWCIDTIWVYKSFLTSLIKSAITTILFISFINIADNLFITGAVFFCTQSSLRDPYKYYFLCYHAKLIELIAIVFFQLFVNYNYQFKKTTWQNWSQISIFPAMSLVIAIFIWRIYWQVPFIAKELLLCTIALLILNIFSVIFLSYLNQQEQFSRDNVILQHSVKIQKKIITTWSDAYKNQRKLTHDFKNQLSVIYGLAEKEAPESELLSYVQSLLKSEEISGNLIVKTGKNVLDVLFSQKYRFAQSRGIQFFMHLDDLSLFVIPDEYSVVLISNLLDNAIEACEKIPQGSLRRIVIKMQADEDKSFIYIENTTASPVKIRDNQIVPPNKQSMDHGYGLRTVIGILNRYNAVYTSTYQDTERVFCFSAQIPRS